MSAENHTTKIEIGSRFTRWVVLETEIRQGPRRQKHCRCQCDCGAVRLVRLSHLIDGTSKSCGCWRNDNLTTHGMTANAVRRDSHEYWIWNMVLQRCRNPKVKNWMDYGGRGITVCESWLKFENFYADMGPRPGKGHSIERIDNNAGYDKYNCRWATRNEQARNKRNNWLLTAFGKTQHLAGWSREYGVNAATIRQRVRGGWSVEDAISKPAAMKYQHRAASAR